MDFRHKEFVRDIQSNTGFVVEHQNIIPTNTALFPLLSQFANNFEKYRFNYLVFYYRTKTSSSSNTSITSLGTVIYAIKYDPTLADFTSKNDMQNYEGAQTCRTDNNLSIKCYVPQKMLYNRPGGLSRPTIAVAGATASDIRNEVIGRLAIAVAQQGISNIPIGELWVDYDVTFEKAKLYQTLGGSNRGARYWAKSTAPGVGTARTLASFASTPTEVSMIWDELNVQFTATSFSFDTIDGAIIEVTLTYQGLGVLLNAAGTAPTQAMSVNFVLSGGNHIPIATSLDTRTPNLTAQTPAAMATVGLNPRTAGDADLTAVSKTWGLNLVAGGTIPTQAVGSATTNAVPSPWYAIVRRMGIQCRGQERATITVSQQDTSLGYSNLQLDIMVLDRPNFFPQQQTTTVLNSQWFTS